MKEETTVRTLMLAAVALLAIPAAAQAHVTLQPDSAPAGGFVRLDVRVPNERDDAGTTKVDVQLPPGFISASYEPVPGWDVKVTRSKAAEPIDAGEGLKSDEQVSRITWTGDGKQGVIAPGQFQDFGLSLQHARTARRATSSPSRRCRPTTTGRSSAGSAPRTPTSPRRS